MPTPRLIFRREAFGGHTLSKSYLSVDFFYLRSAWCSLEGSTRLYQVYFFLLSAKNAPVKMNNHRAYDEIKPDTGGCGGGDEDGDDKKQPVLRCLHY